MAETGDTILACDTCGLAQLVADLPPGTSAECIRCGSTVVERPAGGADLTLALTIAALVLYIGRDGIRRVFRNLWRGKPQPPAPSPPTVGP